MLETPAAQKQMEKAFAYFDLGPVPLHLESRNTPVRLGEILDKTHEKATTAQPDPMLIIGAFTLDTAHHEWADTKGTITKLTEKESALLAMLAHAHGATVSRKTLLNDIWRYADDLETHTLETHVYRLRQKIESDPARPAIILTTEDGYRLSI